MYVNMTFHLGSSPVTTLKAVASSSESINVMWDLPEYPNGPLSEYRIYYQRSDMIIAPPESTADRKTVPFPTQAINITGLEVFTNYSIFIEAIGISNITGNVSTYLVIMLVWLQLRSSSLNHIIDHWSAKLSFYHFHF